MVEYLEQDEGMALRLTPNRSLSWQGNILLFCIMAFIALTVAVGWSLAGAWVILPFAGLEIAFLAYGLYYTSRKCYRQEILLFQSETVRLERGIQKKEAEWEIPRPWVRVLVTAPRHGFDVPRLKLAYRDQEVPLGDFLNREDQKVLLDYLESNALTIEYQTNNGGWWF